MKIVEQDTQIDECKRVVCLGLFDGVHRGHRRLLSAGARAARERGARLCVCSFHDGGALKTEAPRLLTEEKRLSLLAEAGVEEVFLYDFAAIRDLSPHAFVRDILFSRLHCCVAVCGENFRFGRGGVGDAALLSALTREAGGEALVVPLVQDGAHTVSASAIRQALLDGQPELAARLLGRPYAIFGRVAHGREIGRTMCLPTANLPLSPHLLLPLPGVYAVQGYIEDDPTPLPGVANIGFRPTVKAGQAPNCETHFFDEVGDLYGRALRIDLLAFLRKEQRFSHLDDLRMAIEQDKEKAKEYSKTWLNGQN